jgi:hypothetical protein
VLARCGKLLVIAALVCSTGLHWAALQTVAWATMLAANLSCENLSSAVSTTFDGRHLCCLCKAIAAGKKSEKKSDAAAGKIKFEYPPAAKNFQPFAPVIFKSFPAEDRFAEFLSAKPPLPPPRSFPA